MRIMVWLCMALMVAGTAMAADRSSMPDNPKAVRQDMASPANPHGDGIVVDSTRETIVYTTLAEFLGVLEPGYYFNDFASLDWGTINEPSYPFGPVNGYGYTVAAASGVFSIPGAVSTNSAYDSLTITFSGLPVFAVGGDFFGTDFDGVAIPSTVTVTLADGTTVDITYPARFIGFSSQAAIASLTVSTANTGVSTWVTVDNFYVGSANPVAVEMRTFGNVKALFE